MKILDFIRKTKFDNFDILYNSIFYVTWDGVSLNTGWHRDVNFYTFISNDLRRNHYLSKVCNIFKAKYIVADVLTVQFSKTV